MDCNKEEATRAKEIAEKKMQVRDFVGAKKVALKAQQLFSDLDNISQMLTVCDVHCCAGVKFNGEMDWYGILQVEQTADESSIKKQYRKLALLLHPDKNKFAGAEAAFKLIGEANMTLSDRAKRSVYDIKRRANITTAVLRQSSYQQNVTTFARKQPGVGSNFTTTATFNHGNINQQQPSGRYPTFWTMCPKCCMRFQYFRTLLNKSIRCHSCLTNYTASEFSEQAVPCPWGSSANLQNHTGSRSGINMAHGNGGFKSEQNEVEPKKVNIDKADKKEHPVKPSPVKVQRKRSRKVVVESSGSDSYTSTDSEDEFVEDIVRPEEQNAGLSSGRYPRRSCRMKQNVTYKESRIEDDDDAFPSPHKKAKNAVPHHANDSMRKDTSEERETNGGESMNNYDAHESKEAPSVRSFSSPDSEFYDFEQERDPSNFAVDQIWAVYDELDAMPRYYVWIREVHDPFRLRFTWLEHNPLSESEVAWTREDLPIACGNYRLGNSGSITSLQMFSHLIAFNKGTKRNTYDIHPRKGEVWALFKGWDAKWTSDADNHRLYEYEVVRVITDVSDGSDFQVIHLLKVQGFVSLFVPSPVNRKTQIPPAEVCRFSHQIPSYKIPSCERDGIPECFYELDTASLPNNFRETFPSVNVDTTAVCAQKLNSDKRDSCQRSPTNEHNFTSSVTDEHLQTEFHDFVKDRSIEKFKRGQIWALYSDVDQYPKFYAKIQKVDIEDVVVHASWVELQPSGKDEFAWIEKELPATCGRFKVDCETTTFDSTDTFSHLVYANPKADEYDIYPRMGEVWAIYKDWNVCWTCEHLKKCEYYVVEIIEAGDSVVKAILLSRATDYATVFMRELEGVEKMMEIPLNENLRFSHQIPAFQIRDGLGGALKGCWELDPASVPDI